MSQENQYAVNLLCTELARKEIDKVALEEKLNDLKHQIIQRQRTQSRMENQNSESLSVRRLELLQKQEQVNLIAKWKIDEQIKSIESVLEKINQ
jgi:hypothetical protein